MEQLLYLVVALASALASILAWVAKVRWSKEFASAKNEIIRLKDEELKSLKLLHEAALRAKDGHIEILEREVSTLKELNPPKIREYFRSATKQLEEYNDVLKREVNAWKAQIAEKDAQIQTLRAAGSSRQEEVDRLVEARHRLAEALAQQEASTGLASDADPAGPRFTLSDLQRIGNLIAAGYFDHADATDR